ncbi:MAG: hypothetical protein IT364_17735 [Candidatus Hydrogenedentes bacterium]|nr:hypothetical protein [Candidatus Hydrogenedentota bacterium]
MNALAALLVAFGAATIDVALAPDQPLPFVYVDDPLILQLKSNSDVTVTGRIDFSGDEGEPASVDIPEIQLRANGKHWQPLEGVPTSKGRYNAHVTLDAGGSPIRADLVFCRIDRPDKSDGASICVRLGNADERALLALGGIPIRQVELDASLPEIVNAAEAAAKSNFKVSLYLDTERLPNAAEIAENAAKSLGDKVAAWSIQAHGNAATFETLIQAARRGGSRAPVAVVVDSPLALTPFLTSPSGRTISSAILRQDAPQRGTIEALRFAAEQAGHEGFAVYVSSSGLDATGGPVGAQLVRQFVKNRAAGVTHCDLDPEHVYRNTDFGEGYVHLSALVRRLNGGVCAGELDLPRSAYGAVFRKNGGWTIAAWREGGSSATDIPIGAASNLVLTDAVNNSLPVPEPHDGLITLELREDPMYLSGEAGTVLADAARAQALREAKAFVANKAYRGGLPPELVDLVNMVATSPTGRTERINFFGLLRMYPLLEQQWHEGAIRRSVAVPAMASMTRLIRSLCILEQEAGEPFIELLQESLARCGEYQSQYLTGTGGATEDHERADWLSAEVGRLMADAKDMAEHGREIEAVGIASLAEWRARALEFAMRAAPLNTPEPEAEAPKATPKKAPAPAKKKK